MGLASKLAAAQGGAAAVSNFTQQGAQGAQGAGGYPGQQAPLNQYSAYRPGVSLFSL
ncbi:hypothetical protein Slin15195_G027500 [Septoria linicola]|uniref:Uncharacterized protein n=1 Tax=Septoria linicola TaxID=215465 RepID=A0A9Q9ANY7_9PEZI|nr:hypothetical protein Slin15195_G027500 [Septoria linicola]